MDKADRRYTTVCLECDTDLSNERIHLGYTTCVDCSDTEKYSSHTVYPHKTGGYIQPVSNEQADNMNLFPKAEAREFVLRTCVGRPYPYSQSGPQRMYCRVTDAEFRVASAFTIDKQFL